MKGAETVLPLSELWAGQIYGTNTGRVFLELKFDDTALNGVLKLSDDHFGLASFDVTGKIEGGQLSLHGIPLSIPDGTVTGDITATAILLPNGNLSGEWRSSAATAGTFILYPHLGVRPIVDKVGPEQLYTASRDLGVLRLSMGDVKELIANMRRKFPSSKIVVTHLEKGAELARYSDDFEDDIDRIQTLNWLKLSAQTIGQPGLQKVLTIDLGQNYNRVTTQGPDESWVLGEAEATSAFLRMRENRISTKIGKYKVNLNQVIALLAVAALPDLSIAPRVIFLFSVVALLVIAFKIQSKSIPNLVISADRRVSGWIYRAWPTILSWVVSMTAGVAASIIYGVLASHQ